MANIGTDKAPVAKSLGVTEGALCSRLVLLGLCENAPQACISGVSLLPPFSIQILAILAGRAEGPKESEREPKRAPTGFSQ